ncbi:MAG: dipeptide epimerase [Planctomycetes bacterium]|nr:dipeptide epimerase [Planctomycetota bacterium]
MKLTGFHIFHVRIPFKTKFGHAMASRTCSDSIVVRLMADGGAVGLGEGAPREYVTGETSDSVFREIEAAALAIVDGLTSADPMDFIRGELVSLVKGNAARCAVELAMLDLASESSGKPIPDLLQRGPIPGFRSRYSGVIGSGSRWKVFISALKMRLYGFRDVKIKVGISPGEDLSTAKTARMVLGRKVDIRADANGAWTIDEAEETLHALSPLGISCIEEPLPKEQNGDLPALREKTDIPIMLDESLCTMEDAKRAAERGECDLFNIRLSKCGGLTGSLAIAEYAEEHGIRCQLGCQVGETGILSAAGRLFGSMVPGLVHLEGSYERHLLSEDITNERVRFGFGGWADLLPGPGLGVTLDEDALRRHADRVAEVDL